MADDSHTHEEHPQKRLNRQLSEVLQEVRIAMPGVQVLFAFLLAVPFNARFKEVTAFEQDVYLFTLISAGISSVLFIAPVSYHRVLFKSGNKAAVVQFATRTALLGLITLAFAMLGAILLVTSFLFDDKTAAVVTGSMALSFAWLWFGAGSWRRMR